MSHCRSEGTQAARGGQVSDDVKTTACPVCRVCGQAGAVVAMFGGDPEEAATCYLCWSTWNLGGVIKGPRIQIREQQEREQQERESR